MAQVSSRVVPIVGDGQVYSADGSRLIALGATIEQYVMPCSCNFVASCSIRGTEGNQPATISGIDLTVTDDRGHSAGHLSHASTAGAWSLHWPG